MLRIIFIASLIALSSVAFAKNSGLKPTDRVHPQKRAQNKSVSMNKDACAYSCTAECMDGARELIRYCNNPNPTPAPTDPNCIELARAFYGNRQSTSRDQDINDAVAFCARRGADAACLEPTRAFLGNRQNTSRDQDVSDAGAFCTNRGNVSCLQPTYAQLSQRSGTSREQDINETLNLCQR